MRRTWFHLAAGVALIAAGLTPARAQDPGDLQRGVARIRFINGEVSTQRGDSGDWVAATVNTPVLTGDRLSTAPNSRAEVEFDSGNVLRIGGEAVVTMSELSYGRYQMALNRGTVTFRVLRPAGTDIEIDTPSVSVRPSRAGTYRITVTDSGESEITARSGDVEVFTPRGSQWVAAGQTMQARGTASDPEFQVVNAIPYDDWDRWSDSRDRPLTTSPSAQYVPPGVYGTEDLDPYGNWVNVPQYGYVWQPVVAPGWAPYRYGRWVWVDWYGWTWVSYDPWGWAPYHYGRWFFEPAFGWCWYPGAIGVRHYWSPALVAFFGFGGGAVSFGFGNVGWVPLAPFEVLHPWWGRGFYGRPEFFNRTVNVTNVNVVNVYRNARVTNGFTAVSGADFRAGRFTNFVRPSGEELRQASFARGPIPIAPERSNLRFSDRNAFVPRTTGASRVFSYRQPAAVQRVPFGQASGSGIPTNREAASGAAPGIRFGAQGGNGTASPASNPGVRNESGWQRFGEPRSAPVAPRANVTPRTQTEARTEAAPSANRGWSRFGEPVGRPAPQSGNSPSRPATPNNGLNNGGGRQESLRIAPPVVRERPSNGGAYRPPYGGGFGTPRNQTRPPSGGGGFSAPRAPSGGGFNTPRAPSGGGGHSAPHGGGGGGGGHRGR